MEDPRTINRFLVGLLVASTLAAVVFSVYYQEWFILLWWLAAVLIFFVVCRLFALFNIMIFAPILWLVTKLTRKKNSKS
jgi:hypothetical protein